MFEQSYHEDTGGRIKKNIDSQPDAAIGRDEGQNEDIGRAKKTKINALTLQQPITQDLPPRSRRILTTDQEQRYQRKKMKRKFGERWVSRIKRHLLNTELEI